MCLCMRHALFAKYLFEELEVACPLIFKVNIDIWHKNRFHYTIFFTLYIYQETGLLSLRFANYYSFHLSIYLDVIIFIYLIICDSNYYKFYHDLNYDLCTIIRHQITMDTKTINTITFRYKTDRSLISQLTCTLIRPVRQK